MSTFGAITGRSPQEDFPDDEIRRLRTEFASMQQSIQNLIPGFEGDEKEELESYAAAFRHFLEATAEAQTDRGHRVRSTSFIVQMRYGLNRVIGYALHGGHDGNSLQDLEKCAEVAQRLLDETAERTRLSQRTILALTAELLYNPATPGAMLVEEKLDEVIRASQAGAAARTRQGNPPKALLESWREPIQRRISEAESRGGSTGEWLTALNKFSGYIVYALNYPHDSVSQRALDSTIAALMARLKENPGFQSTVAALNEYLPELREINKRDLVPALVAKALYTYLDYSVTEGNTLVATIIEEERGLRAARGRGAMPPIDIDAPRAPRATTLRPEPPPVFRPMPRPQQLHNMPFLPPMKGDGATVTTLRAYWARMHKEASENSEEARQTAAAAREAGNKAAERLWDARVDFYANQGTLALSLNALIDAAIEGRISSREVGRPSNAYREALKNAISVMSDVRSLTSAAFDAGTTTTTTYTDAGSRSIRNTVLNLVAIIPDFPVKNLTYELWNLSMRADSGVATNLQSWLRDYNLGWAYLGPDANPARFPSDEELQRLDLNVTTAAGATPSVSVKKQRRQQEKQQAEERRVAAERAAEERRRIAERAAEEDRRMGRKRLVSEDLQPYSSSDSSAVERRFGELGKELKRRKGDESDETRAMRAEYATLYYKLLLAPTRDVSGGGSDSFKSEVNDRNHFYIGSFLSPKADPYGRFLLGDVRSRGPIPRHTYGSVLYALSGRSDPLVLAGTHPDTGERDPTGGHRIRMHSLAPDGARRQHLGLGAPSYLGTVVAAHLFHGYDGIFSQPGGGGRTYSGSQFWDRLVESGLAHRGTVEPFEDTVNLTNDQRYELERNAELEKHRQGRAAGRGRVTVDMTYHTDVSYIDVGDTLESPLLAWTISTERPELRGTTTSWNADNASKDPYPNFRGTYFDAVWSKDAPYPNVSDETAVMLARAFHGPSPRLALFIAKTLMQNKADLAVAYLSRPDVAKLISGNERAMRAVIGTTLSGLGQAEQTEILTALKHGQTRTVDKTSANPLYLPKLPKKLETKLDLMGDE